MTRWQAVLLDMDGLLLDSEMVYRQLWHQAVADQGLDLAPVGYDQFVGQPVGACDRLLSQALPTLDLVAFRRWVNDGWRQRLASGDLPVKPGVAALLDRLDQIGLPRLVVTSTARPMAVAKLRAVGLADRLPGLVTGDEVVNGKPAPDIYLEAARRLAVDPARCLALEDSPNGMRAARAAGCHAIMVPDLIACPEPDWPVAASLSDVIPLLQA
jgi:HAD superfamily hydrolase (TIGR01509 family)